MASSVPDTAVVKPPTLGRNVSFHLLWSSVFASGVGDRLAMMAALGMLGYAEEGVDNSSVMSGIDFYFFLPYLLWSPIAGWLADRLPRKWLMFAADELRAVVIVLAWVLIPAAKEGPLPADQQWMVWGMICLIGVMAATFVPAKMSIVPSVVGYGSLQRANAVVVLMGVIGNLVGFFITAMVGSRVFEVILIASLCYGVSGWFWVFLKTPWKGQPGVEHGPMRLRDVWRDIHAGMGYALRHKAVLVLIFIAAMAWTGTSIYMPALGVVNIELYGGDLQSLPTVMGCVGLGMLVGALVMGFINARLGTEVLITAGMIGCGASIALQMVVPWYGAGLMLAWMTGFWASVLLVPLNTLLQRMTADHIRGRVFASKEILVETGKVVVAGMIWQLPNTDRYMPTAGVVLGVVFVLAAVWGGWRYLFHGPNRSHVLNFLWRVSRLYVQAVHRLEVRGKHRVARRGAVLLVSNHTAGIDPTLIQSAVQREVRWMMAREYQLPGLGWFWRRYRPILVDRSKADTSALRAAMRELRAGEVVGLFPEGGINRPREGLQELGAGVAMLASGGGVTVQPVWVSGTPRTKRTLLAFFVPSHSRVVYGRPFRLTETEASDRALALRVIRERMLECAGKEGVAS